MNLVVGISGATGALAAERLIARAPWPITLVASRHGREVYDYECTGSFDTLAASVDVVYENDDMWSPIASGSVPTVGMVVLPCSTNLLGHVAAGLADTLIARAAHCHLKSRRPLVLCLREAPLTSIDLENAARVSTAGATVMPLAPPFYMFHGRDPEQVSLTQLMDAYADRVLQLLGHEPEQTWETVR